VIYSYSKFHEGQLLVFDPCVKSYENFPFITCDECHDGLFFLHEKIDLETFPSWNDFMGKKILVSRGTVCIVLKDLGAPFGTYTYNKNNKVNLNVYSVLMNNQTINIFGCDLRD
jgi:hypothetical protein